MERDPEPSGEACLVASVMGLPMRGQMKEKVSREVCITILGSTHATDIEKKMASACLLLLDECDSLRPDKARLEFAMSQLFIIDQRNLDKWTSGRTVRIYDTRGSLDAAISENAAPGKLASSGHEFVRESECRSGCAKFGLPEGNEIHERTTNN